MEMMEARGDLRSIPVVPRGGALFWQAAVQEQMRPLSLGLVVSRAASNAPQDLRQALALTALPARAAERFALFFDDLLSRAHARDRFADVLPCLARLLPCLPKLLEDHYAGARAALGLRLLGSHDAGCLFPTADVLPCLALHLPRLLEDHYAASWAPRPRAPCSWARSSPAAVLFCLFPTASRGEARPPSGHQF